VPEEYHPAVVHELRPAPEAVDVFLRLRAWPYCLFLDSAQRDTALGRYSFVAADPFAVLASTDDADDALGRLEAAWRQWQTPTLAGLPPFQGGAAGLLSYDLARQLERLPRPRFDEFGLPRLLIGLYDVVVAFDHADNRAWLVSQGFPETDPQRRARRAQQRAEAFLQLLAAGVQPPWTSRQSAHAAHDLAAAWAPSYPTAGDPQVYSNFSREGYLAAVRRAIEYIHAGDVFQVNLSQRLLHRGGDDSTALYLRLRQRNAAPFAGYFDAGAWQVASASPERFLQVRDGMVEARPIKGTRRRWLRPEADLYGGEDLLRSAKDRAENVMIVDLLRNDLSRVCTPESVQVTQLCRLETYAYVQHLVSAIRGRLRPECTAIDLLRAAFPGGSVTGAPKVRAMEIIAELEPTARGAYCGSLGYLGFDGSLDASILIRTVTACGPWWQFPVGGGIVAQSDPLQEYEETWHKAVGILQALR
jgi:para-aminobenzoate synthetase component 1